MGLVPSRKGGLREIVGSERGQVEVEPQVILALILGITQLVLEEERRRGERINVIYGILRSLRRITDRF